jgi:hypothetical protein
MITASFPTTMPRPVNFPRLTQTSIRADQRGSGVGAGCEVEPTRSSVGQSVVATRSTKVLLGNRGEQGISNGKDAYIIQKKQRQLFAGASDSSERFSCAHQLTSGHR